MNPETAKIIDRLVTSRDDLRKLDIADYAMIRDAREVMADAANALTNYAKTFAVIQETDQAAIEFGEKISALEPNAEIRVEMVTQRLERIKTIRPTTQGEKTNG